MDCGLKQTSKSKWKVDVHLTEWGSPNAIAKNLEFWVQILSSQALELVEEITKKKLNRDDYKQIKILRFLKLLCSNFSFLSLKYFAKNDKAHFLFFLLVLFSYLANICISLNSNTLIANMGKKINICIWHDLVKYTKQNRVRRIFPLHSISLE